MQTSSRFELHACNLGGSPHAIGRGGEKGRIAWEIRRCVDRGPESILFLAKGGIPVAHPSPPFWVGVILVYPPLKIS